MKRSLQCLLFCIVALLLCGKASAQQKATQPESITVTHAVILQWTASVSTNVVGYNVYRGAASGGPYTKLAVSPVNALFYVDTTIASGQKYYYVATAIDSGGEESVYSNQAIVTAPAF